MRFQANALLQVARFSDDGFVFITEESWSMGAVVLKFANVNGEEIGQAWWYATRREGLNPAAEQPGFNQGTVFARRLDAFTKGQPDLKIREDLAALASKEMPYMDQNAVSKISIFLVAASQKSRDHYPGDAWMTNVFLYPIIP